MANFTLTTGANNFSGAGSDIDVFSGPGGGVDTLNGGGGDDEFDIDGNQTGSITGGNGFDKVAMQAGENDLDQSLTFASVEQLVASTTNLFITIDQATAFSTITAGAGGDGFFLFFQGDGGTIDLSTRYTDGPALQVETNQTSSACKVIGTNSSDFIIAGEFNDTIDGGAGVDQMAGGDGDDLYYVTAGDKISFEGATNGNDTAAARESYALGTGVHVETLKTTSNAGTMAINLAGNELSNTVIGNAGANVINGRGGNDQLIGLGGKDAFVFDRALGAGNVDHISDFVHATDKIRLDHDIFSALPIGALAASAFKDISSGVEDADDRIIYKHTTGALFYDADGAGGANLRLIAWLDNHPANITAGDFVVTP